MKKFNKLTILGIASLTASVLVGCGANKTLSKKLQIVKNNYTSMILNDTNTDAYKDKSIDDIMKTIIVKKMNGFDTYYFNDIDYHTSDVRSQFPAGNHLSRTKQIAVLAKKTNNNKLMDIAIKLVNHWVLSNYRSVNWWHNEIGCNGNLTDIGIILFDKLDPFIQEAFRGKVGESSFYHRPQLMTHEGSNLINYINMSLKNSVFDNNEKEYDLCHEKTVSILKFAKREGEGFMKDGSFHQHGTEMQTASYGLEAVGNIGKILKVTNGTNFDIPEENLEVISKFTIDGISGITHKGKFNFMGLNRAYSRPNADTAIKGTGYQQLKYFTYYDDLPNKEEYIKTLDDIDNARSNFSGVKAFPDSNFIAVNVDGVYMAFMGANDKGRVTESTNGENCLGYNFAWGNNTCVMDTGDEYSNISPVWNYSRLPGCTSVEFNNDQAIRDYTTSCGNSQYSVRLPSKSPDGNKVCVYNFDTKNDVTISMCQSYKDVITDKDGKVDSKSGNSFTITCFATKDGMVIVGSDFGIGASNKTLFNKGSDSTLHTTVEQNIVNAGITPIADPESKSVTNGKVVYSALGNGDSLNFSVNPQKGTFQRNNPDLKQPSEEVEKKILTITYKSTINNNYAYSIENSSKPNNFKLASNANEVHAIEIPGNKIAACFYKEVDSFDYGGKTYWRDKSKTFDTTKGQFQIFDK